MGLRKTPKKDSDTLDAYYGKFYASVGLGTLAEPYLARAIKTAKSSAGRDVLRFEVASLREVAGSIAAAEVDYRELTAQTVEPHIRQQAILALARLSLGRAPDEAVALLIPLTDGSLSADTRWEAHLLLSRAYALRGEAETSRASLVAAWREAPSTTVPADSIAITAMDMAIDRGLANDRSGEIGLITAGRSVSSFAGLAQLPVCDDHLQPEDVVIVAIQSDRLQRPVYSAVRASRSGIAHLFTTPIALAQQAIDEPAFYVALRCRAVRDPNMRFTGGATGNVMSWLGDIAAYPTLVPVDAEAGDPVTQLKEKIKQAEARWDEQAPALVPLLLQFALTQAYQGGYGNASNLMEANGISARAIAILEKARAPAEVLEQTRIQTTLISAQNNNIADVAGPAALKVLEAMMAREKTTVEQVGATFKSMDIGQLRPAHRLALADLLLGFLDRKGVDRTSPIRQQAELNRAHILRELGTVSDLPQRLTSVGIAEGTCPVAQQLPSIPPSAITITSDDYPKDLLSRHVIGLTTMEFSVNAQGQTTDQRVIVSQPPGLFDAVTTEKLQPVVLFPAREGDKAIACRGMIQSVRWKLPNQDSGFTAPFSGYPLSDD